MCKRCAGGALYIRLERVKTGAEQGLALYKDATSAVVCPIHAIAVALAMQEAPSASLLGQGLWQELEHGAPLDDSDDEDSGPSLLEAMASGVHVAEVKQTAVTRSIGVNIHSHVNRLIARPKTACASLNLTLTPGLTSHSFRRGAAMDANADGNLSTQWILDRGGWSMISLSNGIGYIVNTTKEGQKMARSLSGWDSNSNAVMPSLTPFNAVVGARVRAVFRDVSSCATQYCSAVVVRDDVLKLLSAVALLHLPDMQALQADSLYVNRVQQTASTHGVSLPSF